jgi:hypothetical protein
MFLGKLFFLCVRAIRCSDSACSESFSDDFPITASPTSLNPATDPKRSPRATHLQPPIDQEELDRAEEQRQRDLLILLGGGTFLLIAGAAWTYWYCSERVEEDPNPEFTRPIAEDTAFEFSHLEPG